MPGLGRLWGHPMYKVIIAQDKDSGYFYVHESDVEGLSACAPSMDALLAICDDAIPDLLEANHRGSNQSLFSALASLVRPEPHTSHVHINYSRDLQIAV